MTDKRDFTKPGRHTLNDEYAIDMDEEGELVYFFEYEELLNSYKELQKRYDEDEIEGMGEMLNLNKMLEEEIDRLKEENKSLWETVESQIDTIEELKKVIKKDHDLIANIGRKIVNKNYRIQQLEKGGIE